MVMRVVALVGSTGFVGSAVSQALREHCRVVQVSAPRLSTKAREVEDLLGQARRCDAFQRLADEFSGVHVVVNAAGDPDASSLDADRLFGANALLPRVVLEAASSASVARMIHVSSAVVQNDRAVLDETEEMHPFSPYSQSKVAGELVLRTEPPPVTRVTRYRPPSVHAPGRRVSRRVAKIAASPLASVASPGSQPTPQALLPNVAGAVAFLATSEPSPPAVVCHPWEGMTAEGLMEMLGRGRRPRRIPRPLANAVLAVGRTAGRVVAPVAANTRRVELLWMGQGQSESWLSQQGWVPPVGMEGWRGLSQSTTTPHEGRMIG